MNKDSSPLVSVLMPNYNSAKYLEESISSILNQTYGHFELIICDDCSTDNSLKIVEKYRKKDSRIRLVVNKQNQGIVKTRNILFREISSQSKYVAIMDSDDISHKERLSVQVDFLEKNREYIGCGSGICYFWNNSKKKLNRFYKTDFKKIKNDILIKSPFPQSAMMFNTIVLSEIGYYNEAFEVCEDWEFWIRILRRYKMTNVEKILFFYRQYESQSKSKKLKLTILNGVKLKLKYMKFKDYFNYRIAFRLISEIGLLLLPNQTVLWMFYKIEFRK